VQASKWGNHGGNIIKTEAKNFSSLVYPLGESEWWGRPEYHKLLSWNEL